MIPSLKIPIKFTSKVTTRVCLILLNINIFELSTGNYSKSELKLYFILLNTLDIRWIRKGLNGKERKQGRKIYIQEKKWRCGVSNPGPSACKADALPLSYTPERWQELEILDVWWIFPKPKFISQHPHNLFQFSFFCVRSCTIIFWLYFLE